MTTTKHQDLNGQTYTREFDANGAAHVTEPALTLVKYTGGGYTYLCEAAIGSARSDAVWRVARIDDAAGDIVYAGTGLFAHAATDYATLTYTLEA